MKSRPAIATFAMQPTGEYSITISLNLEAISGIGAEHEDTDDSPDAERYNQLRELSSGPKLSISRLSTGISMA